MGAIQALCFRTVVLFTPVGITLRECVIHAIAASSSHCESSPWLAFLLKGKSIAAMSGEGEKRGAGRKLLSRRIDPTCQQERKKKKKGRTPVRNLNNYCCSLQINDLLVSTWHTTWVTFQIFEPLLKTIKRKNYLLWHWMSWTGIKARWTQMAYCASDQLIWYLQTHLDE